VSDLPELDSSATTIEELVLRISALADEHQRAGDETVAADLYEVERSLRAASRRLGALLRRMS